ncbi:hypothetical protein [Nocardioides sp. B-3]|uniref:hypothetical protein n=1 Tax=Nocardioides sp. B-3 TaxID=2895565 RepID=UPI002152F8C6|nr:hypothetical protein [Nocardioides sp. B-3]UUZ58848.1 hypothetical protein LP418_22685 [Nocardioides sp. B-3]
MTRLVERESESDHQRKSEDGIELVHVAQRRQRTIEQRLERVGEQSLGRAGVTHGHREDTCQDTCEQESTMRVTGQCQSSKPGNDNHTGVDDQVVLAQEVQRGW